MQRNRWLKVLFLGIFVLATGAIAVNFWEKLARRPEPPSVEPLAPRTSQLSHDVEFKSYAGRDMVFQVRSERSQMNRAGVQDLFEVNLSIFRPPDRTLADQVEADSARYDEPRKSVDFERNVSILLEDGTSVLSQRAAADLEQQTVRIEEGFSVRRGEVEGSGRELVFDAGENRLEVHEGISLRIPGDQGPVDVRAGQARYWPRLGRLLLSGDCTLKGGGQDLAAQELDLELTDEKRLRRATATGEVVLTGQDSRIEGARLSLTFQPEQGTVLSFRLESGAGGPRARYRRGVGDGAQILQGRVITGVPAADSRPEEFLMSRLEASGDLQIEWREVGIDRVVAEKMTGVSSTGAYFEELRFREGVELHRHGGEERETIRSGELFVVLTPDKNLEELVAKQRPVLEAVGNLGSRRLEAEKEIRVSFKQGNPIQLDALGVSRVREESADETTLIRSQGLKMDYRNGVPASMLARGPVHLEKEGQRPLLAEAAEMRVDYDQGGGLQSAELVGDLKLTREQAGGLIRLSGERAILSDGGHAAKVMGRPLALLQNLTADGAEASRTRATEFHLDLQRQGVRAVGRVETKVAGDEPLTIRAERMEGGGESAWFVYEGDPVIEFAENRIASQRMRLEPDRLLLQAEGKVDAVVQTIQGGESTGYHVEAERLELDREAHQAVFSGDVRADSQAFDVQASQMTLRFQGSNLKTLQEMRAAGNVALSEEGRIARGDEAVYVPAEGKVTVTGEMAQVVDSKQGKAIGRTLTFTLGDDTLLIEGRP